MAILNISAISIYKTKKFNYTEEKAKMIRKNKILFFVIAVLLSFGIVGCGNTNKTTESDITISQTQNVSTSDIQGVWLRDNNVDKMAFNGDGTYQFYSSGMYSESGTYSVSGDGTLVMTSNSGTTRTMKYLSPEEMKNGVNSSFWCIDGNKIYLDNSTNYFTKQ